MTNKEKNAIKAFLISTFIFIIAVSWIISDCELNAEDKFLITSLYTLIVGFTTAMTYDSSENKTKNK